MRVPKLALRLLFGFTTLTMGKKIFICAYINEMSLPLRIEKHERYDIEQKQTMKKQREGEGEGERAAESAADKYLNIFAIKTPPGSRTCVAIFKACIN